MRTPRLPLERLGPGWMLVVGFVLLFSLYEGGRVLNTRPNSYHLWRQADCLSLTANYAAGRPFLAPEIHARIADGGTSGNSAGEFPLIYWMMGQVWKLIGPSEFAYRLFGILLHFAATWAFYQALRRVLGSDFWALTTALLLFTSPVIVYYSVGFLTDVPAFDLALVGWYFVVRHAQEQRRRWWAWAMVCFALAALLKVSAGMSLVALGALLLPATLFPRLFGQHRRLLPDARTGWSTIGLAVAAILGWYMYAEQYNTLHNGRYTFNSVWPIWEMTTEEVDHAWTFAKQVLVFQVFDTSVWLALGVALVALVVNVRRLPWPVVMLNLLLIIGAVAYTLLWFHALEGHDYYFINPMIMLLVLWTTFLWWLRRDHPDLFHARWAKVAFSLLLCFNVAYAANNMQMRYTVFEPIDPDKLLPIYHEHELPFWSADDYYGVRSSLDMASALDSLGIERNDLVIYLDDITINGSLYFMGRKGWTGYGHDWSDPATFDRLKSLGAQYVVFAENKWLDDPIISPHLKRFVGKHRWAYIFDIAVADERSDTLFVLGPGSEWPLTLPHRWDTLTCQAGSAIFCFGDEQYPFEIKDLPLYDEDVHRSVIRISGHCEAQAPLAIGGVSLMLGEDDERGQVSLREQRLVDGPFEFEWTIFNQRPRLRNTFFIWNRTGNGFRLDGLTIRIVQYR